MNEQVHIVAEEESGIRLDKLLVQLNKQYSRQQIQTWIKAGMVTVNNKIVKANYVCKAADKITWTIPKQQTTEILPENIPLEIVYEDDFLIVINKPAGMVMHPTQSVRSGTLVNALKHYTSHLSTVSGKERPGIVHRLDQDTSGLVVVAKDDVTHEYLKAQFKDQAVTRIYEAVVVGNLQHQRGIIRAPIGRDPNNRLKMTVTDTGKFAETHFRVLQHYNGYTHVECKLITGRTHQIRVHFQYINHPIFGDPLYNRKKTDVIGHQALFAKTLCFKHPLTHEKLTFTIDQPEAFKKVLAYIAAQ